MNLSYANFHTNFGCRETRKRNVGNGQRVNPLLPYMNLGGSTLTPDRAKCQTVARKRKGSIKVSLSWCVSPYNKRTMEAGLWGIWAVGPNAESVSYVLST
jgi:hypothetical protein